MLLLELVGCAGAGGWSVGVGEWPVGWQAEVVFQLVAWSANFLFSRSLNWLAKAGTCSV